MGKKIAIEKIENPLRRQVTFSKRRNSLIKKANEISILCDVDVAFIAFSPSGRIIKFSSRPRFEDMIECYIKLPAVKRHERNPQMKNIEGKLARLKKLDHIKGNDNKLHSLNAQFVSLFLSFLFSYFFSLFFLSWFF
ncbi:agamous-like MADS-box protein AGL104 [Hevea brasiliensis]|uniref:agamous-like MADS-box protein AGL104 n=1 Tax=Hevea brasiliensis TaxID=3981 RepID=UPI0025CF939E|nr:agamous-like MADS-box protein AGL104 [Hevea brasiliensis]